MLDYIRISTLNDFIFCARSIYFHELYNKYEKNTYQDNPQVEWTINHLPIDFKNYSTSKDIIQSMSIYSNKYQLCGKIDLYHKKKKSLMERKTKIKTLYQGYIYQLYAQYFCMIEMGYEVEKMKLYSMKDNKSYGIAIPNEKEIKEFEAFLQRYKKYDPKDPDFIPNINKCRMCIYSELCDVAIL